MSLENTPKSNEKWKHEKNGTIYKVVLLTNIKATRPDYPIQVVYEDVENGNVWSRPLSEWHRSFVLLS